MKRIAAPERSKPLPPDHASPRRGLAVVLAFAAAILVIACSQPPPPAELPFELTTIPLAPFAEDRERMVADQIERRGVSDAAVLAAM